MGFAEAVTVSGERKKLKPLDENENGCYGLSFATEGIKRKIAYIEVTVTGVNVKNQEIIIPVI